ncbi:MAG TPA: FHA domain-containing protein [Frankiaceae bacterium]|nr:FHA domain-containing protein [Frankiaceae bacterium]
MATGFLNIVDGNAGGGRITLDNPFMVGRDEAGPGSLGNDAEISRRHARFYPIGNGEILVEDLGSTNGTLVNGERITAPHVLQPGDRITLGHTVLQFDREVESPGSFTVAVPRPQQAAAAAAAAVGVGVGAPVGAAVGSGGYGSTPAAQGSPPAPPASSYGFQPVPPGGGRPKGSTGRKLAALLAVLVLIGGGFGIGYAVKGGKSSKTAQTVGVLDAAGHPSTSGFACVGDRNGNPGPGHFRFLTSACEDSHSLIAQLPLQQGTSGGKTVYYVVTESSDKADAAARKVNYSPKLANAIGSPAVQTATINNGVIDFPSTVNFAHTRSLVAGPTGFPPSKADPPAVGDNGYSPFVKLPSGIVINAPQIQNSTGHADKALKVDTNNKTVLYQETEGRYEDKHVHYASFESGSPIAATIEDVTYAPALNSLPTEGKDGLKDSSREELVAFVNGATGLTNPGRQGENSTILDDADPHNILKEVPVLPLHDSVGDPAYTPGWDVHFAEWTKAAVDGGVRVELQSTDEVDLWVGMKMVTGPGGAKFGPSGFVVNCPLISIDIP